MKKLLFTTLIIALLLSATACGGDDAEKKKNNAKDTTAKVEVVTDDKGAAVTDDNGDAVTKEPKETDKTKNEKETEAAKDSTVDGTVITPNQGDPEEDEQPGIQGAVIYEEDEEGNTVIVQDTLPEQITIAEGGKEKGLWPDAVPDAVPEFTDYDEMFRATFEDYVEAGIKWWSLTFESSEAACDNYKATLEKAGFVKGTKDVFTYGKGKNLVEIYPEDADGEFYISIDIYELTPPTIPNVFIPFETNYVVYFSEDYDNTITVEYDCGEGFAEDAKAYLETLAANGFSVNANTATITKGGKTYSCTIDVEETTLTYTY